MAWNRCSPPKDPGCIGIEIWCRISAISEIYTRRVRDSTSTVSCRVDTDLQRRSERPLPVEPYGRDSSIGTSTNHAVDQHRRDRHRAVWEQQLLSRSMPGEHLKSKSPAGQRTALLRLYVVAYCTNGRYEPSQLFCRLSRSI